MPPAHPEGVPQSGPVPGLSEWEYYFHGRGCCPTHEVNGGAIDVDFWDHSAEYFDTYFDTRFLDSLRHPEPAERRLKEIHRSLRPVGIAIKNLIASGALTPLPGQESHRRSFGGDRGTPVVSVDCCSRTCTARFSERKGAPPFDTRLPTEKVVAVLAHVAEGVGTRKTARLTGVHTDTVTRYTRRAGDRAEARHDEVVAFSPRDR